MLVVHHVEESGMKGIVFRPGAREDVEALPLTNYQPNNQLTLNHLEDKWETTSTIILLSSPIFNMNNLNMQHAPEQKKLPF